MSTHTVTTETAPARDLKPGDRVLTYFSGPLVLSTVTDSHPAADNPALHTLVFDDGTTTTGDPASTFTRVFIAGPWRTAVNGDSRRSPWFLTRQGPEGTDYYMPRTPAHPEGYLRRFTTAEHAASTARALNAERTHSS